jgi:protoheme IX farnesyltransferase
MKAVATAHAISPDLIRTRLADYVQLTKPRVMVLVLATVFTGACLAAGGLPEWSVLLNTLLGTSLVAAGASALNQWMERDSDGLMRRTEYRPLPMGRLQAAEAAVFGCTLGLGGVLYLALALPHPSAALVAGITFVSYVFIYTPLKRKTSLNTLIGAVPGALPPVIGWTAVTGSFDGAIASLFGIVFLWQVPHFLAIAWIYREDYARAGHRMLSVEDPEGRMSGRQMVSYSLALIPVSISPVILGRSGPLYLVGALVLGLYFLGCSLAFARAVSVSQARRVLRASLLYLPMLLLFLLLDGVSSSVALALGF